MAGAQVLPSGHLETKTLGEYTLNMIFFSAFRKFLSFLLLSS